MPSKSEKLFGGIFILLKVKHDYLFRLEFLQSVLENYVSSRLVSKQKETEKLNIRNWVGFYNQ